MKQILDEKFVRRKVIDFLARKGWNKNLREKSTDEHGVDISVWHGKYSRKWLIEIKGNSRNKIKALRSRMEVNFNIALGQILTRIKVEKAGKYYKYTTKYGVGFPASYQDLIFRRLPWAVCDVLNLHVFFVDEKGKVKEYCWKDLKKYKLKNKK